MLTSAQLTTLGTHIRANSEQVIIDALAAGNLGDIRDWYNSTRSPDYYVYRKSVTSDDIRSMINAKNLVDITTADLDRVLALLEIRSDNGFSGENSFDRTAWSDVFSAAAGDESQQAIAALWQRPATNLEHVFKLDTGTGADAANADTSSVTETIATTSDIDLALEATAP